MFLTRRSSAGMTGTLLMDMYAVFNRFHNFVLLLVRGQDRVCGCTCGRHKVYHVVPYNGAKDMVALRKNNYFLSDVLTKQEMDMIVGLLLGLCISFFLLWLDRVWLSGFKYWTANRINNMGFWSRMPRFSNTRDLNRRSHSKHMEDSRGNMVHIKQDVYRNGNRSI